MGWTWITALAAAGLVASTSNAAVGIGGGLLVMPLLSLWFPPRLVVAYTVPMFFASAVAVGWRYRGHIDRRYAVWLIPGVWAGIVAGTWFLRSAPMDAVRWVMGGVAIVFVSVEALRLAIKRPLPVMPLWSAVPLSIASGLTSAMTNLGGTVVSLLLLGRGLSPAMFVGTLNLVMLAMSAAKMAAFYGLGIVSPKGLLLALPSVPAVFLGSWLGQSLNQRLPPLLFRWILVTVIGTSALLLLLGY